MPSPGPVKISHKKDGHQRRPHRFHVPRPPFTRPPDRLLLQLNSPDFPTVSCSYDYLISTKFGPQNDSMVCHNSTLYVNQASKKNAFILMKLIDSCHPGST